MLIKIKYIYILQILKKKKDILTTNIYKYISRSDCTYESYLCLPSAIPAHESRRAFSRGKGQNRPWSRAEAGKRSQAPFPVSAWARPRARVSGPEDDRPVPWSVTHPVVATRKSSPICPTREPPRSHRKVSHRVQYSPSSLAPERCLRCLGFHLFLKKIYKLTILISSLGKFQIFECSIFEWFHKLRI